jgi:branched-chain amino acid transport system substrate-binding protein
MKTTSKFSVLCVALLLTTAACGSTHKQSAANTGSAVTNAPAGPVVIGVVGSFTGAASVPSFPPAINAWGKTVNAAGGLRGSEVKLIVKDVGSAPGAKGLTAVKELIDQDHVVAVISADNNAATWLSYASNHDVPVVITTIGNTAGPDIFQTTASFVAAAYDVVEQAKTAGSSFGFGFCAEVPSCAAGGGLLRAFAKDIGGVDVGVVAQLSAAQPDFTAFCQQLKDAKVQSYYLATASSIVPRIIKACAAQGATAVPLLTAISGDASWLTDTAYEGALVNDFDAPFFDRTNPAIRAYRDAIDKYVPDISEVASNSSDPLLAWVAGQAVLTAANRVDGTITSASLKKALFTFKDETLGGLSVPLTFNQSTPSLPTCLFEWKISHGQRVIVNGGKPRCAPETALAPFIQKAS